MSEMKDYPLTLRLSMQAEHLAGAIYYCACAVYGGSGKMFEALPSDVKRPYRQLAADALLKMKPEAASVLALVGHAGLAQDRAPGFHNPEDGQGSAAHPASIIPLPKLPGWCPQCHTRQESKHDAPYCSAICREAAQRAALYDRR